MASFLTLPTMDDYEQCDGIAIAARVRSGEVSADEVLQAALARIARHNPALNAVVTSLEASARATLGAARTAQAQGLPMGPLHGVPFLVKELVVSVAGSATTSASRLNARQIATADSEIVARMRRAGLVLVGKTNSPEFGLSPSTESLLYGITRNPWRLDLSPGGSSGGSAAAVEAEIAARNAAQLGE